jgi:hypothetical protein
MRSKTSVTHTASVRIVGSAGRDREHAGSGGEDPISGGSIGGLRGCGYTGKSEDDDEKADDIFHGKLRGLISLSLKE